MRIAIACPAHVLKTLTNEDVNNHNAVDAVKTEIDGALIAFEIAGETLDERLASIRDLDEEIGLAIADEDRPDLIQALSTLKGIVAQLPATVHRESTYSLRASESTEATSDTVISHSHAEQNTSIDESSEQHGAEPLNEETEIEAHEEEPVAADAGERYDGFHGQRG